MTRRLGVAAWIAMFVAVAVGSLMPAEALPTPAFDGIDKLEHALGYLVLAGFGTWLFPARRLRVLAGVVAFGIAIELAQGMFTASRSADVLDVVADALGALVAQLPWRRRATRAEHAP